MGFLEKLVGWMWGTPLIVLILGTGLFLTIASGFFQFAKFGHLMKESFGQLFKKHDGGSGDGIITPFEAIAVAIGSAVGVGNIGGVATAIAVGGPGALFWMWVASVFGMVIKIAEVSLALYYRNYDEEGNPYGGPTYYIEKGLGKEKGFKPWWIVAFVFGFGIMGSNFITVSNYTVSEAVASTFNLPLLGVSIFYIICTYVIIAGGIPNLGKIAAKIVPFMCIFYVISGLFIIIKNFGGIPSAFSAIFAGAFTGSAAVGGFAGATMAKCIQMGISRSVYSNEAGWGTSPMIHASARTDHPIKQGIWGAFEVFFDTMIVCTITGIVILLTGAWETGLAGATLTLTAFEMGIGGVGRVVIALSVFLFGLTSTTGWYAYNEILLRHLFKSNVKVRKTAILISKWIYPLPGIFMVLLAVFGNMPSSTIWLFADLGTAMPTFINVFAVLALSPVFIKLIKDYKARYLGIGTVDEDFRVFYEENPKVLYEDEKVRSMR